MQRRNFIKNSIAESLAFHPLAKTLGKNVSSFSFSNKLNGTEIKFKTIQNILITT
jgi:hypothetical protein